MPWHQPGSCRAGSGPWHLWQDLCWGKDEAGKDGCMWNLTGICFPNSYCWCFSTMGYHPQSSGCGREKQLCFSQTGRLAGCPGMWYGFEKGISAWWWGRIIWARVGTTTPWIPHQTAHIKCLVSSAAWKEGWLKIGWFCKLLSLPAILICSCFSWLSWWHRWETDKQKFASFLY